MNELDAVRERLAAPHPAFHADVEAYAALVVALPAGERREVARDMLRKAAGPRYPGKTHELRALAKMLEEGEDG